MKTSAAILTTDEVWTLLNSIPDPEIPVISIVELGVIRKVESRDDGVHIDITPTYSGCPALTAMQDDIKRKFGERGITTFINLVYKPAWTTDWLSAEAKQKLEDYGIAPPQGLSADLKNPFRNAAKPVPCPYCKSEKTTVTSPFGSTACKSLHFCNSCNQPFEHFKCH